MNFYYITFCICFYFVLLLTFSYNKKLDLFFGMLVSLIFISISSFRLTGGTDLPAYLSLWNATTQGFSSDYAHFELGFRYILVLVSYFGNEPFLYLFAVSLLIYIPLLWGLYRLRISIVWGCFLYFNVFYISYSLNAVQQGIVMSLSLVLLGSIANKSYIKGYTSSIFGILLHKSFILFALVSFVIRRNLGFNSLIIVFFASVFISYYFSVVMSFIGMEYILSFSQFEKKITAVNYFQRISLLLLCYLTYKKSPFKDFDRILLVGIFLGFISYIALSELPVLASRVSMFFRIFEFALIGRAFYYFKPGFERIIFVFLVSFLYFLPFSLQVYHEDSILTY